MPRIRWRRCARCSRSNASMPRASSISTATRWACCRPRRRSAFSEVVEDRVGRRADSQLEHRRLDHAVAAHRRQDRAAGWRGPGEVVVADSTSVNLYKVLRRDRRRDAGTEASQPHRRTRIVSERTNFPDRSLHRRHGRERTASSWCWSMTTTLPAHLDERRRHPDADARQLPHRPHARMAAVTRAAHDAGRDRDLGSRALRRRGAGRSLRRRTRRRPPTSRSAAATST